jgi:muramoyltetrapeptide carboxypeptidase LdcA involved in peptidoglycan recycling
LPLAGGNLGALLSLAGTAYWPALRGALLFVEEVELGPLSPLPALDQALAHVRLLGVLDQIAGLVVGKINDLSPEEEQELEQLLAAHTAGAAFPVVTRVDLGHADPRLILPIGARATLDAARDVFRLDEPAVSARP